MAITIRLPKTMHNKLRDLAWHRKISMNLLCVKLIEALIEDRLTVAEKRP